MTTRRKPDYQPRFVLRQPVHCPIVYTDGEFFAAGVVENYTASGICVHGTRPVPKDMNLVVFFVPPGDRTKALVRRGTVRWINGLAFGMALSDVCPVSEAELSRLAALHLPTLWSGLN